MTKKVVPVVRSGVLVASGAMFIYAGHLWNKVKVIEEMLFWFDLMTVLLFSFIAAAMMFDATDKRKNINIILLFVIGTAALIFMLNDPPRH